MNYKNTLALYLMHLLLNVILLPLLSSTTRETLIISTIVFSWVKKVCILANWLISDHHARFIPVSVD